MSLTNIIKKNTEIKIIVDVATGIKLRIITTKHIKEGNELIKTVLKQIK